MTSIFSTTKPSPRLRALQVVGLALVAFVVATVLGDTRLGLVMAAAIVVGELLWTAGVLLIRSLRAGPSLTPWAVPARHGA